MAKISWSRCFLMLLWLSCSAFPLRAGDAAGHEPIVVAVNNRAGISAKTLAGAEERAKRIFSKAGVEVEWINCGESAAEAELCHEARCPQRLELTIAPRSRNLKDSVLGISFVDRGGGCYGAVFLQPVEQIQRQAKLELGTMLGHVFAHETAHLLLGENSHSEQGIMRAHWNERELEEARRGALLFTPEEGQVMRSKVLERLSHGGSEAGR